MVVFLWEMCPLCSESGLKKGRGQETCELTKLSEVATDEVKTVEIAKHNYVKE